jgi:hypothetical protein
MASTILERDLPICGLRPNHVLSSLSRCGSLRAGICEYQGETKVLLAAKYYFVLQQSFHVL